MYSVEKIQNSQYDEYILKDSSCDASATVAVARGGIMTSWVYKGVERVYINEVSTEDTFKLLKGGNPILFPSCGRLKDKKYSIDGKEYTMDTHGFARDCAWQVESTSTDGGAKLTITLSDTPETRAIYPFAFTLRYTYCLNGDTFSIIQDTVNNSESKMPFASGLHPYFCADTDKAWAKVSATRCINKAGEDVEFDGTLHATDDLDNVIYGLTGEVALLDTGLGYKVQVSFEGEYKYYVVWSPNSNKQFVCVEPWTAAPNALNTGDDLLWLGKGESNRLIASYKIVE